MGVRVLVVDDDPTVAEVVGDYLRNAGMESRHAADGHTALRLAGTWRPDLVVLDVMMPGIDGLEVCRRLRDVRGEQALLPVIMLTALGEESDRVLGLETGADDYVTKPFSPRELIARVGAVMRRVRPALAGEMLTYGDIEMDVDAHRVRRNGRSVQLGPTEFRLLRHLMENPGRVFSRERLLDSIWPRDRDIDARTVDVHVRRLRKALNQGDEKDVVRTVRSAGYSLDMEG